MRVLYDISGLAADRKTITKMTREIDWDGPMPMPKRIVETDIALSSAAAALVPWQQVLDAAA